MKSITELSERDVQIQLVPIDLIDFDPENPNEIPPALYETLKQEIQITGFNQPVLLRRDGDRFRMIDGEHRTRIVQELGGDRVPAVVTEEEISDDESQLRLLTMNRLRGQFMPIRFAMLVTRLAENVSEEEVRRRLGMEDAEFRDTLRLADFTDDVADTLREQIARELTEAPTALRFVVSSKDAEVIERVVAATVDGKKDRGQALAAICRHYEQSHKAMKADKPKEK